MNLIAIKLSSGEDILGEIETADDEFYTLIDPVAIMVLQDPRTGEPVIRFAPFPPFGKKEKNKIIVIKKKDVIYDYVPAEDLAENYNKVFGSGIITPSSQLITG